MTKQAATLDIGWDLDGVALDFVRDLRDYIHNTTGRPNATMPDALTWEFYKDQWGMTTAEFLDHFAAGINAGHIFRGAPYPGSIEAMRTLTNQGHRIHIITARHIPGAEMMAEANTRAWLAEYDVPHETLTFSDDKHILHTDVFLEDRDVNYDALEAAGNRPWLITRPWNAHHSGRRVTTHQEFVQIVDNLATRN